MYNLAMLLIKKNNFFVHPHLIALDESRIFFVMPSIIYLVTN